MKHLKVVIGANFGDEGKGLVTDYLCSQASFDNKSCLVVMANGGAQRGHTVELADGRRHVFKHFSSGTYAGADTYFPKQFIVDPMTFKKEYDELDVHPNCFYHVNCRWVTPWDIMVNQIVEMARGDNRHGSCGMGIWETVERSKRTNPIPLSTFAGLDYFAQMNILAQIRSTCADKLISEYKVPMSDYWRDIFFSNGLINHFIEDVKFFCQIVKLQKSDTILDDYDTVVYESGQGLLLGEQNMNFYHEHTTPSNTGFANVKPILEHLKDPMNIEAYYVSRTYMTRHGAGDFYTEISGAKFEDKTNGYNDFQQQLRFGELDSKNLLRRIEIDQEPFKEYGVKTALVLTHLNEFEVDLARFTSPVINNLLVSNGKLRDSIKIAQ